MPPVTDPDEPLQIDSLGLIRLVAFLESDLGIRVEDEELVAENFATLRALGELLATKTPTGPQQKGSSDAGGCSHVFGKAQVIAAEANAGQRLLDASFC